MSDSTTNVSTGGGSLNMFSSTIGSENSVVTLGNISAKVKQTVEQLTDSSESEEPGIKELLLQLQKLIEEEAELSPEDKADLLEQVKAFAEAQQAPEQKHKEGIVRKARKMFDATLKNLPETAKLVDASSKLLPMILKVLGV